MSRKVTMGSASSSVWKKAAPPAVSLVPDTSVPPCMPLVPFKLLPQCWSSEGVSASKSIHRPRRNCLGLQKPSVYLSFYPFWYLWPEVMRISLPGTRTVGWGTRCGAGTPPPQGDLYSQAISPSFYPPHLGMRPACSASLPLHQSP